MKKTDIRTVVQGALSQAGFKPGSFLWIDKPNRLVIAVAGQVKIITFGGMSRTKLERALGRLEGWLDMTRIPAAAE
jgi:hypothetical protein